MARSRLRRREDWIFMVLRGMEFSIEVVVFLGRNASLMAKAEVSVMGFSG
jgi:hypothetical protein